MSKKDLETQSSKKVLEKKGVTPELGGDTSIDTFKTQVDELLIGGNTKVTQELNGADGGNGEIISRFANREEIQELWKNGEIKEEYLANGKKLNRYAIWRNFAISWNEKNKRKGIKLPISINGLIGIIGGNTRISTKEKYVISLLEDKEYIKEVELRYSNKEEIQQLWKNGEIDLEIFSPPIKQERQKLWKKFTKKWNSENKEKGFKLPTSFRGLVLLLDGDIEKHRTKEYILFLLNGK